MTLANGACDDQRSGPDSRATGDRVQADTTVGTVATPDTWQSPPTMSRSLEFVNSPLIELQRALSRSEARYEELVQRAGYGIYRSSPEGRFIEANSVLAGLL